MRDRPSNLGLLAPFATWLFWGARLWHFVPLDDDSMPSPDPVRNGILELLDFRHTLKTPAFQRSFAWERTHIDDYSNDLKRALDLPGGSEDYFLGLIVLDTSDQIQDGQQRLATALLLASEMYDLVDQAKALGPHDTQLAKDTSAQIISALRQSPSAPLAISLQDQAVLLNRAGIRSDSPESAKRLVAARSRLRRHLDADLTTRTTPDSQLGRLKQWGEFLRGGAYVVVLRVPPKDAHNIFETLNTRGVRLSNGDLVKSHLIARASNTALAVSKWNSITDALTDKNGKYEDDLESFLLHYYGSRYERTTKSEFFFDYRRKVEALDAFVALDSLLESARFYRALAEPARAAAFWSEIGPGTQQAVELLNGLGLKQLRYLLLAVLRDLAAQQSPNIRHKKQREAVLKIAAWSVRGLVHSQTGGGDAERTYITAAAEIRKGSITSVDKLRQWFVDKDMLIVDNDLFKDAFKQFQFDRTNSHNRARAILYALEYRKISNKSGLTPRDTLTVEHVLPQSPQSGQWTHFNADRRRVYTHNLGNLLLIDGPSRANDLLANKEWSAKKRLIKSWDDQTPLTTDALKYLRWTDSTIKKRNNALADLAVKAWSS